MIRSFLFIAVVLFFSGCLKEKEEAKCSFDPCSFKATASEIAAVQAYLTNNNITAIQHCSGMFYRIETEGAGNNPEACSDVLVGYKGTLTDGTQFDANNGISFNLGGVIGGWTIGVPLIKKGGRIHLYIPPSLGYGNRQVGSIPANSILIFDINLTDFR